MEKKNLEVQTAIQLFCQVAMNAGMPELLERVARKFGEHLNTLQRKIGR